MNAHSFGSDDQEESQQVIDQSDAGMIIGDENSRRDELFDAQFSNRESRHSTIQITDSSETESQLSEEESKDIVPNRSPTFSNRQRPDMSKLVKSADKAKNQEFMSSLVGENAAAETLRQNIHTSTPNDHFKPFLWMNLNPKPSVDEDS